MPGSASGELQLLSPGKPAEVVKAAPQNVPLPSEPRFPQPDLLPQPSAFEEKSEQYQATAGGGHNWLLLARSLAPESMSHRLHWVYTLSNWPPSKPMKNAVAAVNDQLV